MGEYQSSCFGRAEFWCEAEQAVRCEPSLPEGEAEIVGRADVVCLKNA